MDALCTFLFIIIETIVNKYKVPITSLSLHGAIYLHKPVYIFAHRAALLLNMQNVHILFIITFVCLSVPTYCILMQLNSQ